MPVLSGWELTEQLFARAVRSEVLGNDGCERREATTVKSQPSSPAGLDFGVASGVIAGQKEYQLLLAALLQKSGLRFEERLSHGRSIDEKGWVSYPLVS